MRRGDLGALAIILIGIAGLQGVYESHAQQTEIDLLQEKVWHLEAIIELERFENEQENNG